MRRFGINEFGDMYSDARGEYCYYEDVKELQDQRDDLLEDTDLMCSECTIKSLMRRGYTQERLDAFMESIRKTVKEGLAKQSQPITTIQGDLDNERD